MVFESERDRIERVHRVLQSCIKRVNAGEKPGPLREQLQVALMMSPIPGVAHAEIVRQLDDAIAVANNKG